MIAGGALAWGYRETASQLPERDMAEFMARFYLYQADELKSGKGAMP